MEYKVSQLLYYNAELMVVVNSPHIMHKGNLSCLIHISNSLAWYFFDPARELQEDYSRPICVLEKTETLYQNLLCAEEILIHVRASCSPYKTSLLLIDGILLFNKHHDNMHELNNPVHYPND